MGKSSDEDRLNWKIVRNRTCMRALLIFFGILVMQVFAYLICVLVLFVYALFVGESAAEFTGQLMDSAYGNGTFSIFLSAVSALISGIWCGVLYYRSDWRERSFDYRSAFCPKNTLSMIGIGVGCCIVLTMALTGISFILPDQFTQYNQMMGDLTDTGVFLTVLYVLLIGPVSEELIFRGAILDRFYLVFPFMAANIFQAALFGLYHLNLIQGLYSFFLGILLGLLRYVTGSILAGMGAHVIFNATTYALNALFPDTQSLSAAKLIPIIVLGVVCAAVSITFVCREALRRKREEEKASAA